jgi:hypothetical protein
MTTERRRRPAQAARRVVGGASVAALLGLVAAWSAPPPSTVDAAPPRATVRVVITDPAIDQGAAVAAALDAAARGIDRVTVPVAASAATPSAEARTSSGSHSTTRAS